MKYYKPRSEETVALDALLESETNSPINFVTAERILKDADYVPVKLLIPAELNPYISDGGYICADYCTPSVRLGADNGDVNLAMVVPARNQEDVDRNLLVRCKYALIEK